MGISPGGDLMVQVVSFQEASYVLIATLTLGLYLEPQYRINMSTIIFHRYLGRVRNRIEVWVQEEKTKNWIISEFDVDFHNTPSEWFKDGTPKHRTQPYQGFSLADGKHCISTKFKGPYGNSLREYLIQTRGDGMTLQAENSLEPSTAYNVPGPYRECEESRWGEWTGTMVEFGPHGDIWVFRYGRA
jgi:hypothetical protein